MPKRWFIQALFKFIPNRNCWGWVEDLEAPTEQIPRYQKPVKAIGGAQSVKADAKKPSSQSTQQKKQPTQQPSQSTPPDLIMIAGKTPEITIKFTTRPDLPDSANAAKRTVSPLGNMPGITHSRASVP